MNNKIYKTAKIFINKDLNKQINFEAVEKYLNSLGYVIMFYDEHSSLDILAEYDLDEYCMRCNALTIKDEDIKIVFINKSLSSQNMLYALLHETAHIILKHLDNNRIVANERLQEIEAEAFVYEVLHCTQGSCSKNSNMPKILLVCFIIFSMIVGANLTDDKTVYKDNGASMPKSVSRSKGHTERVLVTPSGSKFHRPDCRYVKNAQGADPKNCETLTRAEALEKYAPCSVCKP